MGAANMLFRVKAIVDRLNKGETSVKFAPELLYFIIIIIKTPVIMLLRISGCFRYPNIAWSR